jgi:hypothetical protein
MAVGKQYLGDSVYREDADGFGLVLTTENSNDQPPSNAIYFGPEVIRAFQAYVAKWLQVEA